MCGTKCGAATLKTKDPGKRNAIRQPSRRLTSCFYAVKLRAFPTLSFPSSVLSATCVGKWIQRSPTRKLPDIPCVGRKDAFECRFLQLHFLSHHGCCENPHRLTSLWTFHHWGAGLGMGGLLAKKTVEREKGLTYCL